MKNLLSTLGAFVLSLAFLIAPIASHEARADSYTDKVAASFNPDPKSTVATGVSVAAGIGALADMGATATAVPFAVAAIGGTGLMYIIASGFDPWTPAFEKVEQSYPKHDYRSNSNL